MTRSLGWDAHAAAVQRLRTSYDALPPGSPVRLSKKTSNLFRDRTSLDAPGLDVSGLRGVIEVDPELRTADVQGMCTYEDLVDATLPFGLIPYVVPQLRTITLGGAVTGLGIESTSFRNGLPHESVLEMDVMVGTGDVLTTGPGEPLFDAFPNSYGSLGYATRIRIQLEPVQPYVALRHVRFDDLDSAAKAIAVITETGEWGLEARSAGTSATETRVDAIDGVVFGPGECYLTLATWTAEAAPTSDYTGAQPYFRSLQQREADHLTTYDYLWRWDTDWFWCSGAFGLHNPRIRRLWPRRFRRSDVYHKLVALEQRYGIGRRLDQRKNLPERERVIQDIEVPVDRLGEFLSWFDDEVGMRPVWICPLRLRGEKTWPSYPLHAGITYVNVGFWGTVFIEPGAKDGDKNRAVEAKVTELGGHKSLYSDAFYDRETFDSLYGTANLAAVKHTYDPESRLTGLYEKAVGNI